MIRGQPGTAFAIQEATLRVSDADNAKPSPVFFNTNLNFTTLRAAAESQVGRMSTEVYDDLGKMHIINLRLIPTPVPNEWLWEADFSGQEAVVAGGNGRLTFGRDGAVAAFAFSDGGSRLEFDPGNGAKRVGFSLKVGSPGDFTGITQFRTDVSVLLAGQNGCPAGTLLQISIGNDGIISGYYSNEESRPLFQIRLAEFPNKQGLKLVGENSFLETRESGAPLVSAGAWNHRATLAPGALEASVE